MTDVTQKVTITYAGVTIGANSASYRVAGELLYDASYEVGRFETQVLVYGSTHANLASAEAALRTAFQTPRGDLVVSINSSTFLTWSQSSNTGINARPRCEDRGDGQSPLTRVYRIVVECDLPASLSGVSGRQSGSVRVRYSASRVLEATLSAVYTALTTNSATAQYAAAMSTWAAAVQSALGITAWELVDEDYSFDDVNKKLTATHRYAEVWANQSIGTLNNTSIVDPLLQIRVTITSPDDYDGAKVNRLQEVTADFSCAVNRTVTTNMSTLWTGTVRPHIISQAFAAFGSSSKAALISQSPLKEVYTNRLSASLTFLVLGGGNLLEQSWQQTTECRTGKVGCPVWSRDPLSKVVFQGPASIVQTQRWRRVSLVESGSSMGGFSAGGLSQYMPGGGSGAFNNFAGTVGTTAGKGFGTGWRVVRRPTVIGQLNYRLSKVEVEIEYTSELYVQPSAGGFVAGTASQIPAIPDPSLAPGAQLAATMPVPIPGGP